MSRLSFETPNILIYLGAIFRPSTLRPHLRVPNIASVDFPGLKRAGYNAVVIDKDNCLTLPDSDTVHPSLNEAWTDLKATFPGRVLVVSNSAGLLSKDPGAIGAEAVSLNLRAPVLVRTRAKPGCAKSIIQYFNGELGRPTTYRGDLANGALELKSKETEEELEVVRKWEKSVEGPILGALVGRDGKPVSSHHPERENAGGDGQKDHELGGRMRERQYDTSGKDEVTTHTTEKQQDTSVSIETKGDLRILVIGDRMMTDTLLANRLSRLLPSVPVDAKQSTTSTANTKPIPSVLSIHSTLLLQPKDVRLLRWIEEKLSKGRVREDQTDWARYTYTIAPAPAAVVLSWKDRVNPFRDTAPLTWHPRSWRPAPLAVGLGTGLWAVGRYTGLGIYRLFSKALEGEVEVAKAMAERAATAKAEAKQVAEKAEIVESVLEGAKR